MRGMSMRARPGEGATTADKGMETRFPLSSGAGNAISSWPYSTEFAHSMGIRRMHKFSENATHALCAKRENKWGTACAAYSHPGQHGRFLGPSQPLRGPLQRLSR